MKKYMLIQKHLFTNKFLDEQATHIMVYHLLKMSIIAIDCSDHRFCTCIHRHHC